MAQHFLLSSKAKTLSLAAVIRMTDAEAYETFKAIRWEANGGEPVCPKCGSVAVYTCASRPIFKCKGCSAQFSVTSDTIFANRKLSHRDYLAAIALFTNGAKGLPALQLSRDLNIHYRSAYVLLHKLRECMGAEMANAKLGGIVEIDGSYYGGHVKPANRVADRKDLRLKENQSGKRKAVVVMRSRNGRTATMVAKHESDAVRAIAERVLPGSKIYADEGTGWDQLHDIFAMGRINHSVAFSDDGVCTNQAESFFSRLRRAEIGVHHKISDKYLDAYAAEMGWREDYRRISNGDQYRKIASAALAHPVSRKWAGYTQRHKKAQ